MLIHKITVDNFMARGSAELELPEAGVTVLTGPNGAGKSRFIEAVSYAFWAETLRDSDPWIEGEAGSVSVLSDVGDATRKITAKGTKTLLWNGQKADTNSRTQDLIKAVCPEFDFWRRTQVFSSGEAAHFSGATDGERKRIMEMLLGMGVFDRAQRAALDALGQANAAVQAAQVDVAKAEGRHNVAVARLLGEYAAWRPGVPPVVPPFNALGFSQGQAAEKAIAELERKKKTAQEQVNRPLDQGRAQPIADLKARLREAEARRDLAAAGKCSKCAQPWHGETPEALEQVAGDIHWELEALEQAQAADANEVRSAATLARLELQRIETELTQTREQLARLAQEDAAFIAASKALKEFESVETAARAEWEAKRNEHEKDRTARRNLAMDLEDELDDLRLALADAETRRDELVQVGALLGVRGLRGHVLGRALDGVEAVANYWLQQIAPGRALSVRSEGDAGKIVIGLKGYGGGKYKAASAGERRRIDAPLLLALAEVAGHGRTRGTLFLDEVFDALDRDGQALVCRALGELGATQSVVVITHAEELARNIPAVQRLEVTNGNLRAI
jgi:DNA repair exonuclease SbcCD ATPase subunit